MQNGAVPGDPRGMLPSVPVLDLLLLLAAGLGAGIVNAVAGGGTFFTFPALLAVGLPPVAANATSALSLGPSSLASAVAYRDEIRRHAGRLGLLAIVSLVGSVAGALILLRFSDEGFRPLVPWLLLAATVLFAASPYLTKVLKVPEGQSAGPVARVAGLALQFVTALYGGFFGAGMGIRQEPAGGADQDDRADPVRDRRRGGVVAGAGADGLERRRRLRRRGGGATGADRAGARLRGGHGAGAQRALLRPFRLNGRRRSPWRPAT